VDHLGQSPVRAELGIVEDADASVCSHGRQKDVSHFTVSKYIWPHHDGKTGMATNGSSSAVAACRGLRQIKARNTLLGSSKSGPLFCNSRPAQNTETSSAEKCGQLRRQKRATRAGAHLALTATECAERISASHCDSLGYWLGMLRQPA